MVTGATGFIGSHLVAALAPDHDVFALVRRTPAHPQEGVEYIEQDLMATLDEHRLPGELDAIVHQAALIDVESLDVLDPAPFEVNVMGTWRVLQYARSIGAGRFVHASTGGVYGNADHPLRETDSMHPMDLYALTKAQGELAVLHTPTEFPKLVLRYFLPYGPGTPNPIPRFIESVLSSKPLTFAADRGPVMNPLHVSDAVAATIRALGLDEDAVINIAGRELTTYADIADFAAQRVGRPVNATLVDRDAMIPYYRRDLVGSTERMESLLGYTPVVPLSVGLAELVDDLETRRVGAA
jgi:UDP-glucose 4-epimerase